jgi:hypothetical protein
LELMRLTLDAPEDPRSHGLPHFQGAMTGSCTVENINFDDLDLDAIDIGMVEIVEASDTIAAPAHGASSRSYGICSCSCSISCIDNSE